MKHKKRYILSIGMLLIQVYTLLAIYGTEVHAVETEGKIGFTGIYEIPGTPDPAPEGTISPDFPRGINRHPSEVSRATFGKLPKTNEKRMSSWTMFGLILFIIILGFWFWVHKKINKESRI